MWVPLEWLAEWVDLPMRAEDLAETLTRAGLEVDSIERRGPDLSEIVVGRVLACERHPDADRLSVCRVDLGEAGDGEAQTIVCGAPNVAAGQRVAVARPGTRLQGRKLKKSKIRGVTSHGMICSERELGLSDEHEGILVLDADTPVGVSLDRVGHGSAAVLEVAITANRGDCASMIGIAREVRAAYGGELRLPPTFVSESDASASDDVRVEIADPAGCFQYAARVVHGVSVCPSPKWLQARLEAAQLRPINVVVDVTNLVLLEFGQPLHAFDRRKLRGERILVRRAEEGEKIETLDGVARSLTCEDLVIADEGGAVALAGVMGGAHSEVSDDTVDVLLESAHFHPSRVRRSARRLGLSTDASYRFERGVDRAGVVRALDRAAALLAELAGGSVAAGVVEARGDEVDVVETILLDPTRVNRLLGTQLGVDEICSLLARLEIECAAEGEALRCHVPTWRNDLRIEVDLIEEVARMHGLDAIEARPMTGVLSGGGKPQPLVLADRARDAMCADGWLEVQTFPFLDPRDLDALALAADDPRRRTVGIRNPVSEDASRLRSTQVPSLLRCARENLHRQVEGVAIFEVSRVFHARAGGGLPEERWRLSGLLIPSQERGLWPPPDVPLFFGVKGVVERLLRDLERAASFAAAETPEPYLHPGASACIVAGSRPVGSVGVLHPVVAQRFEIPTEAALVEVDLSGVGDLPIQRSRYEEVSKHPLVRRDLAIVVDRARPAAEILDAVRAKGGNALRSAEVFDRYEGPGVPEGRVSLAIRLTFQRTDRTLTDEEVTRATDGVLKMLCRRFGAEQRGSSPGEARR